MNSDLLPQRLCHGDRIRLIAPASPFDPARLRTGLARLRALGLVPLVDPLARRRSGFLAGDDQARAQSFLAALEEADTRAIWCIRGGYGSARLLAALDRGRLRRARPKLLIGFSDTTALLLNAPAGAVHGPVVTQLGDLPEAKLAWLWRLVSEPGPLGPAPLGRLRRLSPGQASGRLVIANLSVLASLVGTPWLPDLSGAILGIEDVAEPAYRLDREWTQLVQSGSLRGVRGVLVGGLADCTPAQGRWSARMVLERAVRTLGVPSVSGAEFGHAPANTALPIGTLARLDADQGALTLLAPVVTSRPRKEP